MTRGLIALAVAAAVIEACFYPIGAELTLYRSLHLMQMVALIGWVLFATDCSNARRLIGVALTFSFVGDVINSGLIDLSGLYTPQVLLSIPLFLVAHLLYIAFFIRGLPEAVNTHRFAQAHRYAVLAYLAVVVMMLLGIVVKGLPFSHFVVVTYASTVIVMALLSLRCLFVWPRAGWLVVAGAASFVASDALIGGSLADGGERSALLNHLIWLSYIFAQIGIASALVAHDQSIKSPARHL